ncbi:hypothetical protein I5803_20410 [Caenimonas sp. DR4.4]|uniref:Haemolysin-type calcium binding-related domain-containing protein n=1 Tax=Caenimonas aquaedulcis TaxID=2793270 RepID=A0A931H8R0_9BURK|nr:hypothetical protein [Caenimonas aquaedulcis]
MKLFEVFADSDSGGDELVGRDLLLKTVLTFAKSNGYLTERIEVADDGSTVTLELPSFPNAALNGLRDYVANQLSDTDRSGLSLTPPGRIVIAVESGELTGNDKDELMVGSSDDDTINGGAGDDILVAGAGADSLDGGTGIDALFGGDDDDTLDGGANGDYLYGGNGDDEYRLARGELFDIIRDSDGNGSIWVNDQQLTGGKKAADGYWVSDDKEWGFMLASNGDLVISRGSNPDHIVVRGWRDGGGDQLGIRLSDEAAPEPQADHTFTGDFVRKTSPDDANRYVFDTYGNYIDDGSAPGAPDLITGSGDADQIDGLAGNDALIGRAGDDSIEGGDGSDVLQGGTGADTLNGGAGDDILYGSSNGSLPYPVTVDFPPPPHDLPVVVSAGFNWLVTAANSAGAENVATRFLSVTLHRDEQMDDAGNALDGGTGNDAIFAGTGNDRADGGDGQDVIYGMGGADVLFADSGDDMVYGDGPSLNPNGDLVNWAPAEAHGADFLDGGAGNDTLTGQGGTDDIFGGDDNDLIYGDDRSVEVTPLSAHGNDFLDGEGGNDTIVGGGKGDEIYGGTGDDQLAGDAGGLGSSDPGYITPSLHGDDYVDGEDGNDTLMGEGGSDQLFGGSGNDIVLGDTRGDGLSGLDHGSDYIDGEDGNDSLVGEGGADELFGGSGNDTLLGDDSTSQLVAAFHGADYLDGEDGDDSIVGGGGADTLIGDVGNDKLFGDADDVPVANQGNDVLDGGAGNDSLRGFGGDDQLAGGEGNDTVQGEAGNDVVAGGEGSDDVQGGDGADIVAGDAGNDLISGQAGNDTLTGGEGNDELQGGEGADVLTGDSGNDTLFGQAGDDVLDGGEGNDTLQGGGGNDTIAGDGQDLLLGEDGDDVLTGHGAANVAMDGGAGNDWLEGGAVMVGGLGDDTIFGSGPGVAGGAGNDTYVIAETMGYTWVNDTQGASTIRLTGASGAMTLERIDLPGQPISLDNLRLNVGALSVDLAGMLTGGIANVEVSGHTYTAGELFGQTYSGSMSQSSAAAGSALQGGAQDDALTATGGGATMAGGAGADTLTGSGGNNTYRYFQGDGADTITDAGGGTLVLGAGLSKDDVTLSTDAGAMVLTFGADTDDSIRLTGFDANNAAQPAGIATFKFADGSSMTQAELVQRGFDITGTPSADTLQGTNLADRLTGGAGADTLAGHGGADVYTFNLGDGADVIADGDTALGTGDALRFGAGIAPADLAGLRSGNDVTLQVSGTNDQVTLKGYFATGADAVEAITFADGTSWTQTDVLAAVAAGGQIGWTLTGTAGNDTLAGVGGNDSLRGLAGNDSLNGGAGDDTLDGGADADTLLGGAGSDVYVASFGDFIDEVGGDAASIDTVRLPFPSTRSFFETPLDGTTLYVRDYATGIAATVAAQFTASGASRQIERFEFSDGVTFTAQQVMDRLNTGIVDRDELYTTALADSVNGGYGADYIHGNSGDDTIHGNQGDDELYGDFGNNQLYGDEGQDTLWGNSGNDTLNGGAGLDRLDGGAGNDTYTLAAGQGMEIIGNDMSGTDRVLLAAGITAANVTLTRVSSPAAADLSFRGDSLVVQLGSTGDQMWIENYFDANAPGNIESIQFADGTSWNYAAVLTKVGAGGTVNTQTGTTKADTFTVDHWSDVVTDPSAADIDTINASASFKLPANVSKLTMTGTLNLFAVPSTGADTITGNAGNNWFEPTAGGGHAMIGGAGDDTYVVRLPNEVVTPGLDPASGLANVTITEAAGGGNDTVLSGYWSSTLPDNVENLVLTKPNGWYTSGVFQYYSSQPNDYTHKYIGNAGNNVIDASQYEYWVIYQSSWRNKVYTYPSLLEFQLDGGAGADTLVGGRWADTYYLDNAGDVVQEPGLDVTGSDISIDTVVVTAAFAPTVSLANYAHVENLRLEGGAAGINATGNALANTLSDGSGNNLLAGAGGNDTLMSAAGADTLDGGAGDDSLRVLGAGRSVVARLGLGEGHDTLAQDAGAAATVTVELKAGLGLGDVSFTKATGVLAVTLADGSSISMPDTDALNLRLPDGSTFGPAEIDIMSRTSDRTTPTALADLLYGTPGADIINALDGNDIVYGAGGNDTLTGGAGADVYRFGKGFGQDLVDDVAVAGGGTDDGAIDTIEFDSSVAVSDITVSQQLTGGAANLVLGIASTGDTLTLQREYAPGNAGAVEQVKFADGTLWSLATLKSKVTGTIGTESAEAMTAPATSYRMEGRGGNDTLTGGAGNDTLDGGAGTDSLTGGAGNDSYVVDSASDAVVEASTGGTADTVMVGMDGYTLPANIERGQLTAGAAAWNLTGNGLANSLIGNAGANRLDGGAGNDTLEGGAGNDLYIVDSATDVITEAAGEGIDSVQAAITFTLPLNVENLTLTGSATKLVATGNAGDNLLIGNSVANTLSGLAGNDRLDGGAGNDSMTGGAGNDTFVVDATGDTTVEAAAGGIDTVETNLTWTLATEVEKLLLSGANAVNGTGNASINWLVGNTASNTLNGLAGADVLQGGAGTDTLTDTAGNGAFDGGAGNDVLTAGAGNDLLAGGTGNDTYTLGAGADIVAFDRGDGVDTINAPLSGAGLGELNDVLSLGRIRLAEINFSRETNDLVLRVTGTTDAIRFASWYAATGDQTFTKLQVMVDSTADYQPGSTDALYASRITVLDFKQLVAGYDAARASNPALVNWSPQDALLHTARLTSSDSLAHGGNLAYRYAEDGALVNAQYEGSTGELAAVGFVGTPQDILYGV